MMKISIPFPRAKEVVPVLCKLLQNGFYEHGNIKITLPGDDRPRWITVQPMPGSIIESVSDVISVTPCHPVCVQFGFGNGIGADCVVSDHRLVVPGTASLWSGFQWNGIRCMFRDRKGFKVTWESELVLAPLSPLQIEAPVMRRFSKPDIDYIAIRPDGSGGEIVINSMVSIDLEFT
jgi:hypothetical protein